ncbi:MAG: hypothetical protein KAH56_10655 [Candidatus Krumholzibacteria bacterium]|nr:hypothetical protein [Candidatus Krumholzibacteria bacterium]
MHDRRFVRLLLTFLMVTVITTHAVAQTEPVSPSLVVGEIEIDGQDIFSEKEIENTNNGLRFLRRSMNGLHANTRHYVLRRELLFESGDTFNPDKLAETERNLRALGYLNNVRVTAVDTTSDGRVNIRVATRETWTLRTSFSYSLASGGDQRWNLQLSDRNFLGRGVTLGAGLGQDENASYWNTWYRQRRLFGMGLHLGIDYSSREDGYVRQVFVGKPFYAQGDAYTMNIRFWDNLADNRYYLSNAGPAGIDPTETDRLYALLPFHDSGVSAGFQWRVSKSDDGRIWRLGGGVRVRRTVFDLDEPGYLLSDGRIENLSWLAEPGQPFARDQGTTVFPYVWIHSLGRAWAKGRFILQYGPVEDFSTDIEFDLKAGPAGGNLGSSASYGESRFHVEGAFTKWTPLVGGYAVLRGAGAGDTGGRDVRYYSYDFVTGWIGAAGNQNSPWITRLFAEYGQGANLLGSRALLLGLDRGMRTLEFDGMAGDHLARWNIEQGKAMPWELAGLFRMGFAGFYSGGMAWWKDEDREKSGIRHEAGFGLRFGPTRSANSQIARLDLAWDLNGDGSPVITAITRGFF